MLKTSLMILYAVPLALAFFWSYQYFSVASLAAVYQETQKTLKAKSAGLQQQLIKIKPDMKELETSENVYFDYRKVAALGQTSWTGLLARLEKITPPALRFNSINIRPDKLTRISLEGEAHNLNQVTELLKAMFDEGIFMNPHLKRHKRVTASDNGSETVQFVLEVNYAGESGELP